MPTIAARITLILAHLRQAVAAFAARREATPDVWLGTTLFLPIRQSGLPAPRPVATWNLLCARLARIATRVQALFDRWRAGTLPTPRPSRPGRPYTPSTAPRLPATRAWVVVQIPGSANFATQLEALLADPEFPPFLAAAPQVGRLLRPLCRMLGTPLPLPLALPKRPCAPRPARPPPTSPAPIPVHADFSPPLPPFLAGRRILPA